MISQLLREQTVEWLRAILPSKEGDYSVDRAIEMYELAVELKPDVIMDTGPERSNMAYCMAIDQNKKGKLFTLKDKAPDSIDILSVDSDPSFFVPVYLPKVNQNGYVWINHIESVDPSLLPHLKAIRTNGSLHLFCKCL